MAVTRSIASLILLLFLSGALAQEECNTKCADKFTAEKGLNACKSGCRMAMVFNFAVSGSAEAVTAKCHEGCAKSFAEDSESKDDCVFGCDSQPFVSKGSMEVSISNSDPTFDVVRDAMSGIFARLTNSFPAVDASDSERSSESDEWTEPFEEIHRRMGEEMARFQQIAQHLLDLHNANVAVNRPNGHSLQALSGPSVGNEAKDGSSIIEVVPASFSNLRLYGRQGENPNAEEPSWLARLAMRARRLSILSQWLICAALVLCLALMLSICLAILKQIKAQKYQNLRSAHVVMPAEFGEPLPAKKVPLESPSAAMDYPLIHDSPPPAYDQLSIHKEKPEEKQPEQ